MRNSAYADEVGRRFGIETPPVLSARLPGRHPVTFIRLRSDDPTPGGTMPAAAESAFAVQVLMRDLDRPDLHIGRNRQDIEAAERGSVFMLDLEKAPAATFRSPYDIVRYYISSETFGDLARDNGFRGIDGLRPRGLGRPDPVLLNLAASLATSFERQSETTALFVDHLALAFFTHLVSAYSGAPVAIQPIRGGLAPWQMRRVMDLVEARLADDITLEALARECQLSSSYFSRAFRVSFGRPPYQWLLERRIETAKKLIATSGLPLTLVAEACGFSDQSHLARVFSRIVGRAPSVWRRERI